MLIILAFANRALKARVLEQPMDLSKRKKQATRLRVSDGMQTFPQYLESADMCLLKHSDRSDLAQLVRAHMGALGHLLTQLN